jgi:hypothetical protein
MDVKGEQTMTIREMQTVLEAAGAEVRLVGTRLYVRSTPCGGAGEYGYLVDGDDGSTGSCEGVTRRRGEIAAILRGER